MLIDDGRTMWLRAVPVVAVLAVAGAGCGSDDGGDSSAAKSSGGTADTQRDDASQSGASGDAATGDEAEINAVYEELIDSIYDGDGKRACKLITQKAQQAYAKADTTCVKELSATADGGIAKERPKIYRLKITGDKAMARAGLSTTKKYPVPFVKQDGTWMVASVR